MKKFFAVMLIALVVVSGAFAGFGMKKGPDMMVGAKTGWGMDMRFTKVGDKTLTGKTHSVPVEATFTVDFTDVPVYATVDLGTEVKISAEADVDPVAIFALNAGAGYRYDVNSEFALKAGLDFGYGLKIDTTKISDSIKNVTTVHSFAMFLDLNAEYEIADDIVLVGGFDLGGDLAWAGSAKQIVSGHSNKLEYNDEAGTNLSFAINLGAAYKF